MPSLNASAAALDPNATLLGGMWSPMTAPTFVPQWWHPSLAIHRASVRFCPSLA